MILRMYYTFLDVTYSWQICEIDKLSIRRTNNWTHAHAHIFTDTDNLCVLHFSLFGGKNLSLVGRHVDKVLRYTSTRTLTFTKNK